MWFISYLRSGMGVFGRMSMNNKQRWMGGVVLLGGGVLLAALLLKGNEEIKHVGAEPQTSTSPKLHAKPKPSAQEGQMVQLQHVAMRSGMKF